MGGVIRGTQVRLRALRVRRAGPFSRLVSIAPGPERDRPAGGHVLAPLVGEPPRILLEQPFGVDPVAGECPAAEMVDEQVARHRQLEAGALRPHGQVVVVEEPEAEPLVQPTEAFVDLPRHEQAEARQLRDTEPLPAMLIAPSPGEGVHLIQVAIRHVLHELGWRGRVRHRSNQSNLDTARTARVFSLHTPVRCVRTCAPRTRWGGSLRLRCGVATCQAQSDELVEPGVGDDRVVIQQDEEIAPRGLQPLVDGGREAAVLGIGDDRDRHGR